MEIVSALEKIVGPRRVTTSENICLSYSYNCFFGKDIVVKPDIVVLAETVEEVSGILKAANEYKVPVTPKGAVGGAGHGGPLKGGILLDLVLMDRIISIDKANYKAVAEAGCSFFKLSQELVKNDMMLPTAAYGPGPSVVASALTPANGFGETRYGANINLVEGFEVVLPSGEVIGIGSMAYADSEFGPYYRYITGPDLVGLYAKSNGAFGIITKVAYQCLRRPKKWSFHAYYWPLDKIEDATRALVETTAAEVFDVHLVDNWRLRGMSHLLPEDCNIILIYILNGENETELAGKEQALNDICTSFSGNYLPGVAGEFHDRWPGDFFQASGGQGEDWQSPDPPVKRMRRSMYIFDELIFPSSRLADIYLKMMELCQKYGLWGSPDGAAAVDGFVMSPQVISWQNTIALDDSNPDVIERFYKCRDEFRDWFGKKGGTYQYRLPPLLPDYVWANQKGTRELLQSVKMMLDPNNILSPGTFELGGM